MRVATLAALLSLTAPLVPSSSAQTWTNADVRGFGYVNGLDIHPGTEAVYARTDVAGVFRWDGARWSNLLDGEARYGRRWSSAVESFALDPRVPGRVWAALGDGPSGGVVRTDDDGRTWRETAFPDGVLMLGNGAWRRAGERLAVDPNDSDVVYFGSREDGLWRTADGGGSWSRVASFPVLGDDGGPGDGPCPSTPERPTIDGCGPGGLPTVAIDGRTTTDRDGRTVSANVYVGAMGSGVYRSADGGRTWALAVPMPGVRDNPMRVEFVHGRLQVAVTADVTATLDQANDGALFTYTPDAGGAGGVVRDKTPPTDCPFYQTYSWNTVASHPTDPDLVVSLPFGVVARKVFFTRDFTADTPTWKIQGDEPDGGYAPCADQKLSYEVDYVPWGEEDDGAFSYAGAAAFDLADPDRLWFTTGFGVYRFDDLFADPARLDFVGVMEGLEETCAVDVAAPGGAGPAVYSAVFDAFGFPHESVDALPQTTAFFGVQQNGTDVATTPADPLTAVLVGARDNGYRPAARVTRDGGETWADLPRFGGDPLDPGDACQAYATAGNLAISATDPDRMVWSPQGTVFPACAGFSGAVDTQPHVTDDGGRTWREVRGLDVPGGNRAAGTDFVTSQHLVADAVDGDRFTLYTWPRLVDGTASIWTSTDGGESWAEACRGCVPSFRFPRLVAHPQRAGEVWGVFTKTFGADAQADLLRTTDGGATWNRVTTADSVWAVGFGAPLAGQTNATLYAQALVDGVEGVFYSTDDAATWERFAGTENVPIARFLDLDGDPDRPGVVYAASTCRGVWEGTLGEVVATDPTPPAYPAPEPGVWYAIESASGGFLDTSAGGRVGLRDEADGTDKHWRLVPDGTGAFQVVNRRAGRGPLDTSPRGVVRWAPEGTAPEPDKLWTIESAGDGGVFTIRNRREGRDYLSTDLARNVVWANDADRIPRWLFVRVGDVGGAALAAGLRATDAPPETLTLDRLSPNPARGAVRLRVGLPDDGPLAVEVFDVQGRLVVSLDGGDRGAGWHDVEVPLRGLAPGVYVVRLTAEGERAVRSVTVVR